MIFLIRCFCPVYLSMPPTYSEAISLDSSMNSTFQSCGAHRTMCGGNWHCISMKFKRKPRLHKRLDLRQFWQLGRPSSHFKWRSRHVKHPVRTRLGLLAAATCSGPVLPLGTVMRPPWPPQRDHRDNSERPLYAGQFAFIPSFLLPECDGVSRMAMRQFALEKIISQCSSPLDCFVKTISRLRYSGQLPVFVAQVQQVTSKGFYRHLIVCFLPAYNIVVAHPRSRYVWKTGCRRQLTALVAKSQDRRLCTLGPRYM